MLTGRQLELPTQKSSSSVVGGSGSVTRLRRVQSPDEMADDSFITIAEAVSDQTVTLNIGGVLYKTYYKTLTRWPGTRLFDIAYQRAIDPDIEPPAELFYDRDPNVFSSVLDYYRNGELHIPFDVCGMSIKSELDFWQIDENVIEKCCWDRYCSQVDAHRTLHSLDDRDEELRREKESLKTLRGRKLLQMRLWRLFFRPMSSNYATIYAAVSMAFVFLSIVEFCLETQPGFYVNNTCNSTSTAANTARMAVVAPLRWLTITDQVCSIFFAVDIVVCFVTSPNKRRYASSPMTVINFLSVIPSAITAIVDDIDPQRCLYHYGVVMEMFLVLRILRIGRLFQVLYHFKPMRILWIALRSSMYELVVLLTVSTVATFFFSTLIYYAEGRHNPGKSKFISIPVGLWWSIVTITTVGYGDITPVTGVGFLVGAFCAISGTIIFALTIPVLSNNFAILYSHARSRERAVHEDSLLDHLRLSILKRRRRTHSTRSSLRLPHIHLDTQDSEADIASDELSPRHHQHAHMSDQQDSALSFNADEIESATDRGRTLLTVPRRGSSTAIQADELTSMQATVPIAVKDKSYRRYVLAREDLHAPSPVLTDELRPSKEHDSKMMQQQQQQQQSAAAGDDDESTVDSDDTTIDVEDASSSPSSLVTYNLEMYQDALPPNPTPR